MAVPRFSARLNAARKRGIIRGATDSALAFALPLSSGITPLALSERIISRLSPAIIGMRLIAMDSTEAASSTGIWRYERGCRRVLIPSVIAIGVEEAVRAADRNTAKITRRTMSKPRMIPLNEKTMNQNENIGSSEGWKNAFMTKTVMKNALNRLMLLSVFIKLSFPILYTMRITANETM